MFDGILGSLGGYGPDAVDNLLGSRLHNFRQSRRGEKPQQHSALEKALLFRKRHQEPPDLEQAERPCSCRLREAKVTQTSRGIDLEANFEPAKR